MRQSESLMDSFELGCLLRQLSSKLEVLKLDCKEAEQAFLEDPLGGLSLLELDPSGETVENSGVKPRNSIWNIGEVFPNLTTLHLTGDSCLTNSDLTCLPNSLTNLKITSAQEDLYWDTSILPRGLLKLHMGHSKELSDAMLKTLPPGLTVLDSADSLKKDVNIFPSLPSTLTDIPGESWHLTTSTGPVIPPSFRTLDLTEISCPYQPWTDFLPLGLTNLDISSIEPPLILTKDALRALPRTILELSVSGLDWSAGIQESDFPPNLWSLFMDDCSRMSCEDWGKFPKSSMRKIVTTMIDDCIVPTEALQLLFSSYPNLNFLRVTIKEPNPHKFVALPESTRDLIYLRYLSLRRGRISSATLRERLPSGITNLRLLANPRWKPEDFKGLPRSLKTLTFSGDTWCHNSWFQYLPRALETFNINDLKGEIDESVFQDLPPSLDDFSITERLLNIPLNAFKHLPHSLKSLDFATNPSMGPEVIALLPRSLTYLDMNFSTIRDEDFKNLPRGLQHFRYRIDDGEPRRASKRPKSSLTAAVVPYVPESLHFDLPWYTSDCPGFQAYRSFAQVRKSAPTATPDPRVLQRFRGGPTSK
jgi:hypothetical protein